MKYFAVFIILAGLAFPVFAQNTAITQRFNTLNESMSSSISKATSTLADFDTQIKDKSEIVAYTTYLNKYNFLAESLEESEGRFDLLIRTNDRNANIKAERDTFEDILKRLQAVKTDYDNYLKSR
jgi:hypothetical protein